MQTPRLQLRRISLRQRWARQLKRKTSAPRQQALSRSTRSNADSTRYHFSHPAAFAGFVDGGCHPRNAVWPKADTLAPCAVLV